MQTIDDPSSPHHGHIVSNLPANLYIEAANSSDDIGVLLRAYALIETAAENLCKALYFEYSRLQHESLSKHLRAIRAFGFDEPVLRMADVVAKHRGPSAHVKVREITSNHVDELNSQSNGILTIRSKILDIGHFYALDGSLVSAKNASLRLQYLVMSMLAAGAIDLMAQRKEKTIYISIPGRRPCPLSAPT